MEIDKSNRSQLSAEEITKAGCRPVATVLFTCLFWFVGLAILLGSIGITQSRLETQSWIETTGKVVKFDVRKSGRSTEVDFRVSFMVDGRQQHGTRLSISGNSIWDWLPNPYKMGDTVPVFYEPLDPSGAVIERTDWFMEILGYLIGPSFFVLPFWIFRTPKAKEHSESDSSTEFDP